MPKDRVTLSHQGYGFVEFKTKEDAEFAVKILNITTLLGLERVKLVRVNKVL